MRKIIEKYRLAHKIVKKGHWTLRPVRLPRVNATIIKVKPRSDKKLGTGKFKFKYFK